MKQTVKPLEKPIIIQGPLTYQESVRAFATIRLKRRIIDEFPQLQENKKWCYRLEYERTYTAAIQRIERAKASEEGIPLLLFIYTDGGSEPFHD